MDVFGWVYAGNDAVATVVIAVITLTAVMAAIAVITVITLTTVIAAIAVIAVIAVTTAIAVIVATVARDNNTIKKCYRIIPHFSIQRKCHYHLFRGIVALSLNLLKLKYQSSLASRFYVHMLIQKLPP